MGSVTSGPNAADTIRMGEILFGGRAEIERAPVSISLINVNSPLRYDDRMLSAMFEYVKAGQAVVITPFLLMGAMSPVSLPATLVQQMAEALAGIALAQTSESGMPGRVRVVSVEHRHAVRLAVVRHARVGIGVLCTGPDRAVVRAAVARRWRVERVADRRRPGGVRVADDVSADVPRGRELRHALGRLARGRPRLLLREVHRRHRAPARAASTSSRRSRSTMRRSRSTPTSRSVPAATSSARRTRWSASGTASTGRCCPRPRTSTAGRRRVRGTRRRGRVRSGARLSSPTRRRRSTTACAPSSRSSSCAAGPSSATDRGRVIAMVPPCVDRRPAATGAPTRPAPWRAAEKVMLRPDDSYISRLGWDRGACPGWERGACPG